MLLNLGRRVLACIVLVMGVLLLQPNIASAQASGQESEKPIAIFYARDMSERRAETYALNLSERMNFAESLRRDLAKSLEGNETEAAAPDTIDGYVFFLVSGPIPSLKTIGFWSVADATAARRLFETNMKNEGVRHDSAIRC